MKSSYIATALPVPRTPYSLARGVASSSLARSFCSRHHFFRLSCPSMNTSNHFESNFGSGLPTIPPSGSPTNLLTVSKYSSKSGNTKVNGAPSPFFAIRSCSHFSCSLSVGNVTRPARSRAARTACHSNILKVRPAPTCQFVSQCLEAAELNLLPRQRTEALDLSDTLHANIV